MKHDKEDNARVNLDFEILLGEYEESDALQNQCPSTEEEYNKVNDGDTEITKASRNSVKMRRYGRNLTKR